MASGQKASVMRNLAKLVPTTGVYPLGFKAGGIHCGIKKDSSLLDLGLVVSETPASAAACFTRNAFQAAPVTLSKRVLDRSWLGGGGVRGLVVNSGCANAVTGKRGMQDAELMSSTLDACLGQSSSQDKEEVGSMVMSTGVIGQFLPIDKICAGIPKVYAELASDHQSWIRAARAFMTTDTFPKLRSRSFTLGGASGSTEIRLAGIDKGAGMIHPDMAPHATLLGLMVSDANIEPRILQEALGFAVDRSFNAISVDGDMSTNDTVVCLANGASKGPRIESTEQPEYETFRDELTSFAQELSQLVVRDGEGATKFVTVTVTGARSFASAKKVASTISTSALVKCALYGQDANWGRILCAVGYSGIEIDPTKINVAFMPTDGSRELRLLVNGEPESVDEARASEILAHEDLEIKVDLGLGEDTAQYFTCDFSHEYVTINGSYRSFSIEFAPLFEGLDDLRCSQGSCSIVGWNHLNAGPELVPTCLSRYSCLSTSCLCTLSTWLADSTDRGSFVFGTALSTFTLFSGRDVVLPNALGSPSELINSAAPAPSSRFSSMKRRLEGSGSLSSASGTRLDDDKFLPVWKQEVRDEQGRRRFHGAFTGGFSAGYYNTVGSREGWQPATFKSRRGEKGHGSKIEQNVEDFMDEEDKQERREARYKHFEVGTDFQDDAARASDAAESKKTSASASALSSWTDLFAGSRDKIGDSLLRAMGWRPGTGLGPRLSTAAYRTLIQTAQVAQTAIATLDDAPPNATWPRPDTSILILPEKTENRHGLGWKQEEPSSKPVSQVSHRTLASMTLQQEMDYGDTYDLAGDLDHYNQTQAPLPDPKALATTPNASTSKFSKAIAGRASSGSSSHGTGLPANFVLGASLQQHVEIKNTLEVPDSFDVKNLARIVELPEALTFPFQHPFSARTKDPTRPNDEVQNREQEQSMDLQIPRVDLNQAQAALAGYMPFVGDSDKLSRYKDFLYFQCQRLDAAKYEGMLRDDVRPKEAVQMELSEFEQAARIFKPMSSMMANRFQSGSIEVEIAEAKAKSSSSGLTRLNHDKPPEAVTQPVENFEDRAENENRPVDQARAAARAGLFGSLTRKTTAWNPAHLVCKRMGVKDPYPDGLPHHSETREVLNNETMSSILKFATDDAQRASVPEESAGPADTPKAEVSRQQPQEEKAIEARPPMDLFRAIFADDSDEGGDEVEFAIDDRNLGLPNEDHRQRAQPADDSSRLPPSKLGKGKAAFDPDLGIRVRITDEAIRSESRIKRPKDKKKQSLGKLSFTEEDDTIHQIGKVKRGKSKIGQVLEQTPATKLESDQDFAQPSAGEGSRSVRHERIRPRAIDL